MLIFYKPSHFFLFLCFAPCENQTLLPLYTHSALRKAADFRSAELRCGKQRIRPNTKQHFGFDLFFSDLFYQVYRGLDDLTGGVLRAATRRNRACKTRFFYGRLHSTGLVQILRDTLKPLGDSPSLIFKNNEIPRFYDCRKSQ